MAVDVDGVAVAAGTAVAVADEDVEAVAVAVATDDEMGAADAEGMELGDDELGAALLAVAADDELGAADAEGVAGLAVAADDELGAADAEGMELGVAVAADVAAGSGESVAAATVLPPRLRPTSLENLVQQLVAQGVLDVPMAARMIMDHQRLPPLQRHCTQLLQLLWLSAGAVDILPQADQLWSTCQDLHKEVRNRRRRTPAAPPIPRPASSPTNSSSSELSPGTARAVHAEAVALAQRLQVWRRPAASRGFLGVAVPAKRAAAAATKKARAPGRAVSAACARDHGAASGGTVSWHTYYASRKEAAEFSSLSGHERQRAIAAEWRSTRICTKCKGTGCAKCSWAR